MSEIFFTSDPHFCHSKPFLYSPRGFNSVEEMNESIINNWNEIITNNDIVYVLGDIMLNNIDNGVSCWNCLKGIKKIILGNHDSMNKIEILKMQDNTTILGFADMIQYNKINFYLSHYPTITAGMPKSHFNQNVINLFGHTHQSTNFYNGLPYNYHVGMDSHNNKPIHIEDIIIECKTKHIEIY